MLKAKNSGRWMVLTVLLAVMLTSCDENSSSGDYTSIEGIYKCQESSPHAGVKQYIVEIDKVNNSENLYIILNFHNKGQNEFLFAELDVDKLLISDQVISDIRVEGEGQVDEEFKSIQVNYLTNDGINEFDYYASYSR